MHLLPSGKPRGGTESTLDGRQRGVPGQGFSRKLLHTLEQMLIEKGVA